MTNSDTTFGTHNKLTQIYTQVDDGSTALINFADVAAAQNHYFTEEAMAVFNECCTRLQWEVTDNLILKCTMDFGVVADAGTAGWGDTFNSRKQALIDADGFTKVVWPAFVITTSEAHLF